MRIEKKDFLRLCNEYSHMDWKDDEGHSYKFDISKMPDTLTTIKPIDRAIEIALAEARYLEKHDADNSMFLEQIEILEYIKVLLP